MTSPNFAVVAALQDPAVKRLLEAMRSAPAQGVELARLVRSFLKDIADPLSLAYINNAVCFFSSAGSGVARHAG
jgi:hypothetical protein